MAKPGLRLSDHVLAWVDRYRRLILGSVLLLYIAGFNGQWRLEPDSALYLSVGRSLVEGNGYTYHGKAHRLAYPGVPVLMAGVFKVFGTRSLLPPLIVMWVLGLGTLGLIYRLFLLHGDRPTAVVVTVGVAMSRLFYRYNFELLSDLPFLLGVMAFLVGHEAIFHRKGLTNAAAPRVSVRPRPTSDPLPSSPIIADAVMTTDALDYASPSAPMPAAAVEDGPAPAIAARWYDWIFLLGGLVVAVSTRPAMWALVFAVVASLLWLMALGRLRWGQVLIAVGVIAAVALFYLRDPRHHPRPGAAVGNSGYDVEDQMFHLKREHLAAMARTIVHNAPATFDRTIAKATFGMPLGTGLNTLFGGTVMVLGVLLLRRRPLWGMWVLMTVLIILLVPEPMDRYFLPILPLLVFGWWRFLHWLNHRLPRFMPGRRADWIFALLLTVGAIPNGAKVFDFIFEQQYRPFRMNYKLGRYASADPLASMISTHTATDTDNAPPATAWVIVPPKFGRIMTFLTRRYCIEPGEYGAIDPDRRNVWLIEPSDLPRSDPAEDRPRLSVHQWLSEQALTEEATSVASVANRDPDQQTPWTLHRVRPAGAAGTTRPSP